MEESNKSAKILSRVHRRVVFIINHILLVHSHLRHGNSWYWNRTTTWETVGLTDWGHRMDHKGTLIMWTELKTQEGLSKQEDMHVHCAMPMADLTTNILAIA